MISIKHSGSFKHTENFFNRILKRGLARDLDRFGREGAAALSRATPVDSGKTADSWGYKIHIGKDSSAITWTNSNINEGVPIAVILQYGHGTKNGGYVKGIDYINPALRPIFERIADSAWEEVTKA